MKDTPITEARLQSECFQWHWNTYENERGLLFTVDNNANDQIKGSIRKAMGRIKGVSDMIYLYGGKAWCFEFKLPGAKQSIDQWKWQRLVQSQDLQYVVVSYYVDFQKSIDEIHKFGTVLPF